MAVIEGDLGVLRACEQAADGQGDAPSAAFVTWLVGQHEGWPAARKRVSRTGWYRHLSLLKRAGVEVPVRSLARGAARTSVRELNSGAGLLRMVGKRLQLIAAHDAWHPAGTYGTVVQVLFRNCEWLVGVQFDGVPGSYEEIDVGRFARIVEWIAGDDA